MTTHPDLSTPVDNGSADHPESVPASNCKGSFSANKDTTMSMAQTSFNRSFSDQTDRDESFLKCFSHKTIWEQVMGVCTVALSATTLGVLISIFLWL